MSEIGEYSKYDEIQDTTATRPHVVILGAGASLAAFPNGDRCGKILPLMNNLLEIVGLDSVLAEHAIKAPHGVNFEDLYAALHEKDPGSEIVHMIEGGIENYFSDLRLPDHATIYDYLVLSLRDKDLIATFNWDPLLFRAWDRNRHVGRLPHIVYLHGSVAVGYCIEHRLKGPRHSLCSKCRKPFTQSRLLYPIKDKNYTDDPYIAAEWSTLRRHMGGAFLLTIFGYSAPASDVAAIALMKGAWGDVKHRELEQTEIIDVKNKEELTTSWKPFIHTHHYDVVEKFNDSWMAKHPRRSVEAALQQYVEAKFIDENPAPATSDLLELWDWHDKLTKFE